MTMYKLYKLSILILLGVGTCNLWLRASSKVDSLTAHLSQSLHDTDRVNTLNALGWEYKYTDPDTSFIILQQALALAEKIKWQKGKANALRNIGGYNLDKGNYPQALEYYFKTLKINEELLNSSPDAAGREGTKKDIAASLGNIGNVYYEKGDYAQALKYYFEALKINKELGNKGGIARHIGSIGIVYYEQGDYTQALKHYFEALEIDKELGNKTGIAANLCNIGIIYDEHNDYFQALKFYFEALEIANELVNKNYIASILGNIGLVYKDQGNYPQAMKHYFNALEINKELGNKAVIAMNLGSIGSLYCKTVRFNEAEAYLDSALTISESIGTLNITMQIEEDLSHLYDTLAQLASKGALPSPVFRRGVGGEVYYQLAYQHYKKYSTAKDTIFNEEKSKEIGKLEAGFEYEKQILKKEKEHEKKQALAAAELKRQRIIGYAFIGGFGLMLILAFVIYRSLRQKKIANKLLEDKNTVIAEKNKNITDSIRYAQNIQDAILPSEEEMKKNLPEHFVLFMPRDIVSGDFYWFHQDKKVSPQWGDGRGAFIAVCDCTGHGVPGAFVSMIGNDLLNQLIIEKEIENPGEILTQLNNGVKSVFTREGEEQQVKDGMDMALVTISRQSEVRGQRSEVRSQQPAVGITLQYAGANNPLYIIHPVIPARTLKEVKGKGRKPTENVISNGYELTIIDGDKTAIGGDTKIDYNFTNHKIDLKKGDTIYMFSDGYQDQFGGDTENQLFGKGKKFMKKRLSKLFLSIQDKSIQEQKEMLHKTMTDWKGDLEQTDDICVIGLRL